MRTISKKFNIKDHKNWEKLLYAKNFLNNQNYIKDSKWLFFYDNNPGSSLLNFIYYPIILFAPSVILDYFYIEINWLNILLIIFLIIFLIILWVKYIKRLNYFINSKLFIVYYKKPLSIIIESLYSYWSNITEYEKNIFLKRNFLIKRK